MISWIKLVDSILTLDEVSDERIIALVPFAQRDAAGVLGKEIAESLADSEDEAYMQAVAHYIIARLVISSRPLVMGQGFPDSSGSGMSWGDGTEKKAAISDLLQVAALYRSQAYDICQTILKGMEASPDSPRWYVL